MATATNTMQITAQGLLKVSKELINKRTYDSSKITTVGEPVVTDEGIASSLDSTNYFQYNGLSFADSDEVKLNFEGTFSSSTGSYYSCAWSLSSSVSGYAAFNVACYSNKVSLLQGATEVASISNLAFSQDDNINVEVTLSKNSYVIKLLYEGVAKYATGNFTNPIELSKYTYVLVGNYEDESENFWKGSLDLSKFIISKGEEVYYAPSVENSFNFTKIMAGDGVFPLTDYSEPLLNHVYEFPVEEIVRSGGNALLKANIGSGVHLTIKEVGLYTSSVNGTQLFALISGLDIKKGKDIGYDLIFHVNVNLEVVNTNLYPTIVLTEEEYISGSDFYKLELVHLNDTEDMERVAKRNATEVGYNQAQTFCRLQDDISLCEKNCTGTQTYKRLKDHFKYSETEVFDAGKVVKVGSVQVSDEGIASGFSTSSYLTSFGNKSDLNSLELDLNFTTGSNITSTQAIIYTIDSVGQNVPIRIWVENGYCHTSLAQAEILYLVNDDNEILEYVRSSKTTVSETSYYTWGCSSASTNQTILTTDKNPTSSSVIYNFSATVITTLTFNMFTYGYIFVNPAFAVQANTEYFLKLTYDGNTYVLTKSTDGTNYTTVTQRTINEKPGYISNISLGAKSVSSTVTIPFSGSINLYNFKIATTSQTYAPRKIIYDKLELDDFYFIPEYLYSIYKVNDLNNSNNKLQMLEDSFTGNEDHVNFANTNGFTLCVKTYLKDAESKVILAKIDENENVYFNLSFTDTTPSGSTSSTYRLAFNLYLSDGKVITLKKDLTTNDFREFTDNPILLTIVKSENSYNPTFTLYKNNTLVATVIDCPNSFLTASDYYLSNFISSETRADAVNCVQGIYTFKAPITSDKLYYLNNLLDTNF